MKKWEAAVAKNTADVKPTDDLVKEK